MAAYPLDRGTRIGRESEGNTPFVAVESDRGSGQMVITVRPLDPHEGRLFLEIHSRAIRGLAAAHYPRTVASVNAESSYAFLGYQAERRTELVLGTGVTMAAVKMAKPLRQIGLRNQSRAVEKLEAEPITRRDRSAAGDVI